MSISATLHHTGHDADTSVVRTPGHAPRPGWPDWAAWAAGAWSLFYAALGLFWMLGGQGFPFGPGSDPGAGSPAGSALPGLGAELGGAAIAVLGLLGTLVAAFLARGAGRPRRRPVVAASIGFAWLVSAVLLLVVPDARLLAIMAYAFVFVVGAPFGWPPVNFFDYLPWPVLNQALCVTGGLLWAATALAAHRRAHAACAYCGRSDRPSARWTTRAAAARWGRWAVAVATVTPLVYATTRYAWALGIPLGIAQDLLEQGRADGMWLAAAGLATVATAGALLTLGLVQHWGEVFPRWMLGLAGQRVPPLLAIAPASVVAAVVTAAGLRLVGWAIATGFPGAEWATIGPGLLWPAWGIALGAATLAYHYRRRGGCGRCGRGMLPDGVASSVARAPAESSAHTLVGAH